jgi:uncharacterized circularly permuted ATP-grasp superfamily protein
VVLNDDCVYMRTVDGLTRVDVIYRRIDDLFLDPGGLQPGFHAGRARPDAGLAQRQGGAGQCPGAGVADDKVIYAFVPEIIRYYLARNPCCPMCRAICVSTSRISDHVLANLDKLVVKPANESGGYGMLIGPHATRQGARALRRADQGHPRNYMAQPTLTLSTSPTLVHSTSGAAPCGSAALHSLRASRPMSPWAASPGWR